MDGGDGLSGIGGPMSGKPSPALAALILALRDVEAEVVAIAEQVPADQLDTATRAWVDAALALAARRRGRVMATALVKRLADEWLARP